MVLISPTLDFLENETVMWTPDPNSVIEGLSSGPANSCISVEYTGTYLVVTQMTFRSQSPERPVFHILSTHDGLQQTIALKWTGELEKDKLKSNGLFQHLHVKANTQICVKGGPSEYIYNSAFENMVDISLHEVRKKI